MALPVRNPIPGYNHADGKWSECDGLVEWLSTGHIAGAAVAFSSEVYNDAMGPIASEPAKTHILRDCYYETALDRRARSTGRCDSNRSHVFASAELEGRAQNPGLDYDKTNQDGPEIQDLG